MWADPKTQPTLDAGPEADEDCAGVGKGLPQLRNLHSSRSRGRGLGLCGAVQAAPVAGWGVGAMGAKTMATAVRCPARQAGSMHA